MNLPKEIVALAAAAICYFSYFVVQNAGGVDPVSWYVREFFSTAIVTLFGSAIGFFGATWLQRKVQAREAPKPLEKQVDYAEDLIRKGKIVEISASRKFNAEFETALDDYPNSIHVAIMSPSSLAHYLDDGVHAKWSDHEIESDGSEARRRIVILPDLNGIAASGDGDRLMEFFQRTANTLLLEKDDIFGNGWEDIYKDCAVFYQNGNQDGQAGFLTYCPRGNEGRFSKDASINFRIEDPRECQKLRLVFGEIWDDKKVKGKSELLSRVLVGKPEPKLIVKE